VGAVFAHAEHDKPAGAIGICGIGGKEFPRMRSGAKKKANCRANEYIGRTAQSARSFLDLPNPHEIGERYEEGNLRLSLPQNAHDVPLRLRLRRLAGRAGQDVLEKRFWRCIERGE
jgi:hypothetical protein